MVDLALEGVSKRYRIKQEQHAGTGLLDRIRRRLATSEFWAVRDVSFEVQQGEAVGIIGHNGAGKSTLLKLLSGITAPTTGVMRIRGRMAALLEVGSGFHPELTGRENIFLSGSILGMRRRTIHENLDRIIDFAEVRPFIDIPVKRYSSGMYVRLGFSIAAHLAPDILLLDEVLAVGDASFQEKCKERIIALKRAGTTIVFISHDLKAVQSTCDRVLVMKRGEVIHDGTPEDSIRVYTESVGPDASSMKVRAHTGDIDIQSIQFLKPNGSAATAFSTGEPMRVSLNYAAVHALNGVCFYLYFNDAGGDLQCVLATKFEMSWVDLQPGSGEVEFEIEALALQPGIYRVDVVVELHGRPDPLVWVVGYHSLHVTPACEITPGMFYHPQRSTIRQLTTD